MLPLGSILQPACCPSVAILPPRCALGLRADLLARLGTLKIEVNESVFDEIHPGSSMIWVAYRSAGPPRIKPWLRLVFARQASTLRPSWLAPSAGARIFFPVCQELRS